ncbi:PadR family transcriptional regulator [Patulibacter minatonensis]|uniref:PadR family transcriptional regulator n=1 Tax=Patulibacter minatonensis TaxID=298163 RepID=UPI000684E39D|nr:PadR family transcriptional regulator [Patulibacter minatonensis]
MDSKRCTTSSTPSDETRADDRPRRRHGRHGGPRHRRCAPPDGFGGPGGVGPEGFGPGDPGPGGFGFDGFDRAGGDAPGRGHGPWARYDDGPGGPGFGPGRGRGPGGPGRGRGRGPGGRGPGGPGGGRGGDPELPGFLPPGARVGRGDIRAGILVLLLEGPMHGYQLIHELRERSGGVWRPSPGSVYPTLKRLSAEGLVTSEEGEGRGHRRAFSLSATGEEEATRLAAESTPWEALVDDDDRGALELRDLVVSVVDAARQVVRVAEPEQAAAAKDVLVEARRKLYGILAAEPTATADAAAASPTDPAGPTGPDVSAGGAPATDDPEADPA